VVLRLDGTEIAQTTTDAFGEFKIDRLEPNSGPYELEVDGRDGRCVTSFDLGADSRYLGALKLSFA
jgi:hypothetical protein